MVSGTGENFVGPSLGMVQTVLEKSLAVQEDQAETLNKILEKIDPSKFAAVLGEMMKTIAAKASNEPSMKEKDKINMGRTNEPVKPSVDFSRRAM